MTYDVIMRLCFFFFNDTATTEIYTLSLHDALPIFRGIESFSVEVLGENRRMLALTAMFAETDYAIEDDLLQVRMPLRSEEHTLNSSHANISYAVFCLKKKKKKNTTLLYSYPHPTMS